MNAQPILKAWAIPLAEPRPVTVLRRNRRPAAATSGVVERQPICRQALAAKRGMAIVGADFVVMAG
jgi:hypothetical protein